MTQIYQIVLDGQLGQRAGTLSWTEENGDVNGTFSLLGFDNPVRGKRLGQRLELFHNLRTAVSVLSCRTQAELRGGRAFRGCFLSEQPDEAPGKAVHRSRKVIFHCKRRMPGHVADTQGRERIHGEACHLHRRQAQPVFPDHRDPAGFFRIFPELGPGGKRPDLLPAGKRRDQAGSEHHGGPIHHLRHGGGHGGQHHLRRRGGPAGPAGRHQRRAERGL